MGVRSSKLYGQRIILAAREDAVLREQLEDLMAGCGVVDRRLFCLKTKAWINSVHCCEDCKRLNKIRLLLLEGFESGTKKETK